MACYIFGAGSFYGLDRCPRANDFIIAADGGWLACRKTGITPDLLLGDFDSLSTRPDFPNILRVPVEKDDTDTMLAVKTGLERGETEFHIYGGMGGRRTDHTIANFQALLYLARRGAQGWPYAAAPSPFPPGTGAFCPCSAWEPTPGTSASREASIPCTTRC